MVCLSSILNINGPLHLKPPDIRLGNEIVNYLIARTRKYTYLN